MVILFFFVSGGGISARWCGGDCYKNAAICDKCHSWRGYCHVNEVFCDDWCDEQVFPQEDLIRRLRVILQ